MTRSVLPARPSRPGGQNRGQKPPGQKDSSRGPEPSLARLERATTCPSHLDAPAAANDGSRAFARHGSAPKRVGRQEDQIRSVTRAIRRTPIGERSSFSICSRSEQCSSHNGSRTIQVRHCVAGYHVAAPRSSLNHYIFTTLEARRQLCSLVTSRSKWTSTVACDAGDIAASKGLSIDGDDDHIDHHSAATSGPSFRVATGVPNFRR